MVVSESTRGRIRARKRVQKYLRKCAETIWPTKIREKSLNIFSFFNLILRNAFGKVSRELSPTIFDQPNIRINRKRFATFNPAFGSPYFSFYILYCGLSSTNRITLRNLVTKFLSVKSQFPCQSGHKS